MAGAVAWAWAVCGAKDAGQYSGRSASSSPSCGTTSQNCHAHTEHTQTTNSQESQWSQPRGPTGREQGHSHTLGPGPLSFAMGRPLFNYHLPKSSTEEFDGSVDLH